MGRDLGRVGEVDSTEADAVAGGRGAHRDARGAPGVEPYAHEPGGGFQRRMHVTPAARTALTRGQTRPPIL